MRHQQAGLKLQFLVACLFVLFTAALPGSADIYEWEYIDPLQPELGKQESTTLVPDGAGVDAVPGASLYSLDLTKAYLVNKDLTDVLLHRATLSQADMTGAFITGATLTRTTDNGLTFAQIASTASFQAGDLQGIRLDGNDLSGWDLSGQDLTNTSLASSTLIDVDLTDAVVVNTNFSSTTDKGFTEQILADTESFKTGSISGIDLDSNDLTGWDFSGLDLSWASFSSSTLVDADLTDAMITGAKFDYYTTYQGFTEQMLASTASYKSGDLTAIKFDLNDLTGWDLSGQDLRDASLRGVLLVNVDLKDAILNHSDPTLRSMSGADTRRANLPETFIINSNSFSQNLIWPDGTLHWGIFLAAGESMWIRDDDGGDSLTPIPITAQGFFYINTTATLRFLFEDPNWGSTILFEEIDGTLNLGGTLELSMKLDDGLTPGDLLGASFQLFDWTGVSIVGDFGAVVLDPAWYAAGLSFDLSQLMSTGEVRVVPLIGDLDGDGFVGITDLSVVLSHWNQDVTPGNLLAGDMNGDGFVGIEDLNGVLGTWNAAVPPPASASGTAIPEPGGAALLGIVGMALSARRNRRSAA